MRRPRGVRVAVTAVLLVAAATSFGYCAAAQDREDSERREAEAAEYRNGAADAARTASFWSDSSLQERWAAALVARKPLDEWSSNDIDLSTIDGLRLGNVDADATIGNEPGQGVIDYATATDQNVHTMGAKSTLRAVADGEAGPCASTESCDPVKVVSATSTTMSAPTARGAASVPAWLFEVDGLISPLVLPAVTVDSPEDVAPGHEVSSRASLIVRDGLTLTVTLTAPYCGSGYERHLLETDAAIVVWATGTLDDDLYCAVAVTKIETFTLRAPIDDRAVVDSLGALVLPDAPWRLTIPQLRTR